MSVCLAELLSNSPARRLRIRQRVPLPESMRVALPIAAGRPRPVALLPARALSGLPDRDSVGGVRWPAGVVAIVALAAAGLTICARAAPIEAADTSAKAPADQPAVNADQADEPTAARLQRLWAALGSADRVEAEKTAKAMVALGDRAVTFLAGRFYPPPADASRVAQLVAELDDAKYAVRKKAYDELTRLGGAAVAALEERLKLRKLSVEARARIEQIVRNWAKPPPGTARWRRLEGALQVLARVRTARSSETLARMARQGWVPSAWGRAADGLQAAIRPGGRSCRIGEALSFEFVVRNVGKQTIHLTYGVPGSFTRGLKVLDANGQYGYLWQPVSAGSSFRHQTVGLAPGDSVTLYTFKLTVWPVGLLKAPTPGTLFARPGKYRLTHTDQFYGHYTPKPTRWSGGLSSGQVHLEILPPRPGDPINRALAAQPAPRHGASRKETAIVLSLMGRYTGEYLHAIMVGSRRTSGWLDKRKVWEKSCKTLSPGALKFLGYVATHYPDSTSRAIGAEALGNTGWAEAGRFLIRALKDPAAIVRSKASRALGNLRASYAIPELLRVVKSDGSATVRSNAAYALGHIGSDAATAGLAEALGAEKSVSVKRAIALALGWITDPAALPALRKATKDSDAEVRRCAGAAIRNIEDPEYTGLGVKKGVPVR